MKTLIVAVVLLASATASAQDIRPSLRLPLTTYAAAASFDVASTVRCLHLGCREDNPAINWLHQPGDSVVPMLAFGEFLDATAVTALMKLVAPRHPRLARTLLYTVAGVRGSLAVRNMTQVAGQRVINGRLR